MSVVDSDAFLSPPEETDDEDTIDVEEKTQMQVWLVVCSLSTVMGKLKQNLK